MTTRIYCAIVIVGLLFLSSCSTYYISVESFKQQFAGIDSSKLKDVLVKGPGFSTFNYKANPITEILCTDKNNNPVMLRNSPSIETRITYGHKNRRTVFYFDRIYISNESVVGVQSRIMDFISKTIPLDSITKIEVQDGHKKFTYVNK